MALKTFNVDAQAYEEFSKHCKKEGLSMSKKVENFIKDELERMKFGKVPERIKLDVKEKGITEKQIKPNTEHSFSKYC